MFTASIFTIAKIWKQPKCPSTVEWINTIIHTHTQAHAQTHTYTNNGILLSYKNEILPFSTTWIDLEGVMLSELCQTEKDIYSVYRI